MNKSKRYQQAKGQIDKEKTYPIGEAIELAKKTSTVNFDAGIEVHAKLGIDTQKSDQQVRGTITLPHGLGKAKKIAVFAQGEKAQEAKEAGADSVGGQELIDEIKKSGKIDFDIAVATPDMMKNLASIAKILGPKGLMPSPKNETVTMNIKSTVSQLKKGKTAFKNDDGGIIHFLIGKTSFDNDKLIENFNQFIEALKKAKPTSSKGTYIKNIYLTSSMGPSIKTAIPA